MAAFEQTPQKPAGYEIPLEILTGEFRKSAGDPERQADPNFIMAKWRVMSEQAGRPDPDLVERVYLEESRAAAAFTDIAARQGEGPLVAADYMGVSEVFKTRIGYVLSGEQLE